MATPGAPPAAFPPFPVTVHPFPSPTPNSCAYERGPPSARNALVFIGGLTSGPHAVDLGFLLNKLENSPTLDYSLWEFRMRSSYSGFGYSSLVNDIEDMAALVGYLRGIGKEKIVFMGASTGTEPALTEESQDCELTMDLTPTRLPRLPRVRQTRQRPHSSSGRVYPAEPGL